MKYTTDDYDRIATIVDGIACDMEDPVMSAAATRIAVYATVSRALETTGMGRAIQHYPEDTVRHVSEAVIGLIQPD